MNCKNLKIRSNKGIKQPYCILRKEFISFSECGGCKDMANKETKPLSSKGSTLKVNKPLKAKTALKAKSTLKSHSTLKAKTSLKAQTTLKPSTHIKPVSKHREFVSDKTYEICFARCKGKCLICGTKDNLHLHHINGRGKGKTDNPDNCVMLCQNCHLNVVHANNKKWRPLLNEQIQKIIENEKNTNI